MRRSPHRGQPGNRPQGFQNQAYPAILLGCIYQTQDGTMAKTSSIQRNLKRVKLTAKYLELRKKLKVVIRSETATPAQKDAAQRKLQALPRNSSPVRVHSRCQLTGRSRAYVRRFGLSRIAFRENALQGNIPGVRKASW